MSTATSFKCPHLFGHEGCIPTAAKGTRDYFPYDMDLAEAMRWHWNLESIRLEFDADVLWWQDDGLGDFRYQHDIVSIDETSSTSTWSGSPVVVTPAERVCQIFSLFGSRTVSSAYTRRVYGPNIGDTTDNPNVSFGCGTGWFGDLTGPRFDSGDDTYWHRWSLDCTVSGTGVWLKFAPRSTSGTLLDQVVQDFGDAKAVGWLYLNTGGVVGYTINSWSFNITPSFFTY